MRLVNGRNLVEEINVNEILKGGGLANDMMLRDGDILHIPSRPDQPTDSASPSAMRGASSLVEDPAKPTRGRDNGVFVTGRVKSAGFVELSENVGLTAYTAILAKGGFAPFANIKKVFVVREVGGGQKVHIPVNIRNVQHGLEPDIELRVEDIRKVFQLVELQISLLVGILLPNLKRILHESQSNSVSRYREAKKRVFL